MFRDSTTFLTMQFPKCLFHMGNNIDQVGHCTYGSIHPGRRMTPKKRGKISMVRLIFHKKKEFTLYDQLVCLKHLVNLAKNKNAFIFVGQVHQAFLTNSTSKSPEQRPQGRLLTLYL